MRDKMLLEVACCLGAVVIFLNAGECLCDGHGTDNNIFDAILLSPMRMGHAFPLFKHGCDLLK
jgi:hypothetical protein